MQRKVFRVEQMFADRRAAGPLEQAASEHGATDQLRALRELGGRRDVSGDALKRELMQVHDTVAHNRRELASLIGERQDRRMARAAGELGAAVAGMEKATQKILHAAETIDDDAKALTATLKDDYKRGLAQDIQDYTAQIYEACNFQDLAGQRIAKVIATLNLVEEQLSAMLARCNGRSAQAAPAPAARGGLINGPKLDGDAGHADQPDIDAMFV